VQVLVDEDSADPVLPRDVSGPETVGPHPVDLDEPRGIQGLAAFVPACGLCPSDTFDLPLALEVAPFSYGGSSSSLIFPGDSMLSPSDHGSLRGRHEAAA
jgi:hypothetical protein